MLFDDPYRFRYDYFYCFFFILSKLLLEPMTATLAFSKKQGGVNFAVALAFSDEAIIKNKKHNNKNINSLFLSSCFFVIKSYISVSLGKLEV